MILQEGNKGKEVKELQSLLGLSNVDGIFGNITKLAIKAFQKKHNLTVDGIMGPETWKVLVKDKKPVESFYQPVIVAEDFSDPEEQLIVEQVKEDCPTSAKIEELAALILNFKYTRKIRRIIYHCTATQPTVSVTAILNYWRNNLGWKNPGYHIIVKADGSWTLLQNFNLVSNGVAGRNSDSIHVSYIGGIDVKGKAKDTRTKEQHSIFEACYNFFSTVFPDATHNGHNEFSNKACPSFNVKTWINSIKNK